MLDAHTQTHAFIILIPAYYTFYLHAHNIDGGGGGVGRTSFIITYNLLCVFSFYILVGSFRLCIAHRHHHYILPQLYPHTHTHKYTQTAQAIFYFKFQPFEPLVSLSSCCSQVKGRLITIIRLFFFSQSFYNTDKCSTNPHIIVKYSFGVKNFVPKKSYKEKSSPKKHKSCAHVI